ncbi:MAG: PAS domain-containing protein [bacterium]|nr:PAS domain-containing protein [bacterium]
MLGIIDRIKTRRLTELDRYVLSVCGVIVSLIAKFFIHTVLKIETTVFLLSFWPVALGAWIGGWRVGLFAGVLEILLLRFFFITPRYTLFLAESVWNYRLLFFALELLVINAITSSARVLRMHSRALSRDLTSSLRRFKLLSEQVQGYAFFFLNTKGRVIEWNLAAHVMFGVAQPAVMSKQIHLLFPRIGDQSYWRKVLTVSCKKASAETEGWIMTPEGTRSWLHIITTPLYDTDGKLEGYGVICRDRSERKEIETEKDRFIDDASHELKTPVTSIKLFTQILERRYSADTQNADIFRKLNYQLDSLTDLVNMILDISRIQNNRLEPNFQSFSVSEWMQSAYTKFSQRETLTQIQSTPITSKQEVVGDKARLTQAVTLLLLFVGSFAERGSKVWVKTRISTRRVEISVGKLANPQLVKDQESIFSQLHNKNILGQKGSAGLGFGVYFAYQILQLHGGTVEFVEKQKDVWIVMTLPTMPVAHENGPGV